MQLRVLSDIHLEHERFTPPAVPADVVVLAGDIAPGTAGIDWAAAHFGDTPVVYIAGNHEYYGQALPDLNDELEAAAIAVDVHPLEDGELILGGVRFLGCTLWSDFELAGAAEREQSMELCERLVNDYSQIRFGSGERRLRAADTRAVHLTSRDWLAQRLAEPHDGPTVVVTHHAPLVRARPDNPIMRAIAGAFASDLSDLIAGDGPDLWIFGHTHRAADLELGGTRILSNQRGYPHEPDDGFRPRLVVEV